MWQLCEKGKTKILTDKNKKNNMKIFISEFQIIYFDNKNSLIFLLNISVFF